MKPIATISAAFTAAVLAFAMFFCAVDHPLLQLAAILGVMVLAVRIAGRAEQRGRRFFRQLDEACNPAPRRHRVWPFVALALVTLSGCRPELTRIPEPVAALAEVETLDCGGARGCAITDVAGATMITVLE
jgi:hypothetical protein